MSYHDESSLEIQHELVARRAEDRAEQRAEILRARQQDEDDQEEQELVGDEKPLPLPGAE